MNKKGKDGIVMNGSEIGLRDAIERYLEFCVSKQLRPRTMKAYRQGLELFAAWSEQKEKAETVQHIGAEMIRRYIVDLQTRGKYTLSSKAMGKNHQDPKKRRDYNLRITNTTINNYIRYLRAFFIWMEEEEYIEKTPMKRIRTLPNQRRPKEYLDDAEILALFSVFDRENYYEYRDAMIMMVMLDSGTRIGETLSIESQQVDFKECSLFLPAEKTKGKRARTVFFSEETAEKLQTWMRYKEERCDSSYLFPTRKGGKMLRVAQYENSFKRYIKRTGIKKSVSPHTLRNNFARRCLLSGMDIYTLSRILGHSSVTITERAYLDIRDIELKSKYKNHSPIERIFHP